MEIDAKNFLAGSLFVMASVYKRAGQLEQATRDEEETLRISREAGDKALEGLTLVELGSLHDWKGEYAPALRLQDQELKRSFLAAMPVKELREEDVGVG